MQIFHLITTTMPKITRVISLAGIILFTKVHSMEENGFLDLLPLPPEIKGPVIHYMESLPKISAHVDDDNDTKATAVVNLFIHMIPQRNQKTNAVMSTLQGRSALETKIKDCMMASKSIKMITIGFPFKSSNHELKVIDEQIDMGEFIGLLTYEYLCQEIKKIYEPGGFLTLFSDGPVYKDLDISNGFQCYQDNLKRLGQLFPSINIANSPPVDVIAQQPIGKVDDQTKMDIGYFMGTELDCALWKKLLLRQCIHTIGIESCSMNHGMMTINMHINEEKTVFKIHSNKLHYLVDVANGNIENFIYQYLDDNSQLKTIKQICLVMNKMINLEITDKKREFAELAAQTSGQFSSAVKSMTNGYHDLIRLSVHPHNNISEKCGISVVYGSTATPWHACPILGSHGVNVMSKADLLKRDKNINLNDGVILKITIVNGVLLKYISYDLK